MVVVTYDTELMTQQVAAVETPNATKFIAVNDENGSIMIFSIGSDGVFYLTKETSVGSRNIVNLSRALNIVGAKISAFDVAQNVKDTTLYIVVASTSGLIVLKPFKPRDVLLEDDHLNLTPFIMGGGPRITTAQGIFMNKGFVGDTYPDMVIAYVPLNQVHNSTDIARLQVTRGPGGDSWTVNTDLKLPENASSIMAVCAGMLPVGSGYFALYLIQGQTQLIFTSFNTQYPFQVSLRCPPGAKSLATVIGADGMTALLVGGQGLYYWTAADAQKRDQPGAVLSSDDVFQGITELYVTQTASRLSIFAANTAQGMSYAVANIVGPIQIILTSPLLADGRGGRFSALLSPNEYILQLIVADNNGALTMLQQNVSDGIWSPIPLFTPSLSEIVEIQAYTVHIDLLDGNHTPLANRKVLLSSPRWGEVLVNGRSVNVGPNGVPVVSDGAGTVTLVVPTEDISASTFSLYNVSGDYLFQSPVPIDPTFKVNQKLKTINRGQDLRNATLQSGGTLLKDLGVTDAAADEAANAIVQLHNKLSLAQVTSPDSAIEIAENQSNFRPGVRRGADLGRIVAGHNAHRIIESRSIKTALWGAWKWLTTQTKKFTSWVLEKIGGLTNFIVEIADQFIQWTVNTAKEAAKVITWVFKETLKIAERIIDWLGFILNWGDIQRTQRSIVAITNSGLQAGQDNLSNISQKVDRFFVDLEDTIKSAVYPDELLQKVVNPGSTQDYTVTSQSKSLNATSANYTNYQFTHGGAASASNIPGSVSSNPLQQAWTNIIEPVIDSLKHSVMTIGQDLVHLFSSQGKSISTKQVLQKLGVDILLGIIDAIRSVVVGLVKMGAQILSDFKGYLNLKINIPIFSALYKKFISGGSDLSLLDGLALIIAIPVTVLTKMATGRTTADLTSVNYNDLVNGRVTDPTKLKDINSVMSPVALTSNGLGGIMNVLTIFSFDASSSEIPRSKDRFRETSLVDQQIAKFRRPHPLKTLLERQQTSASQDISGRGAIPIATDWQLALGVVSKIVSIPLDNKLPGYPIRWISWLVGCASPFIGAAIRSIEASGATSSARKKALAATDGVLAMLNFALVCTINGLELKTTNFPGRDTAMTTLQIVDSTFDVISSEASAVSDIATDPATVGVAEVVSLATMGFAYAVAGSIVLVKLATGQTVWIIVQI